MEEDWQITKYRWEFLRRNKEYQDDWKDYFDNSTTILACKLLDKWKPWNFPQSMDFNKGWDDIKRIHGAIWSKELESEGFWPELKNHIWQKMLSESAYNTPNCSINPELLNDPKFSENIVYTNEDTKAENYHIRIGSDLNPLNITNVPDTITITLTNFRNYFFSKSKRQNAFRGIAIHLVNQQLKLWESASNKISDSKKKQERFIFDSYDQHLQVWDLVQIHGENWKKISNNLFPNHASPESAIKTVKRSFKTANELIHKAKDFFIEI